MCRVMYMGPWAYAGCWLGSSLHSKFNNGYIGSATRVDGKPCIEGATEDRELSEVVYAGVDK